MDIEALRAALKASEGEMEKVKDLEEKGASALLDLTTSKSSRGTNHVVAEPSGHADGCVRRSEENEADGDYEPHSGDFKL